ncbi:HesA/MoeB/ThiF family protein [Thermosulfuriphilus sp.]
MARGIFARQLSVISEADHQLLSQAKVLVAGLGGLGAAVSEALVRLGIGGLVLVDPSRIDWPDINRQILYTAEDIGRPKVEVALERLARIRPGVQLWGYQQEIGADFSVPEGISGIVDALDNFRDRFILDKAAKEAEVFLVHAGLNGLLGQVTTILPHRGPRLTEIFAGAEQSSVSPPALAPICLLLGAIEALEVAKIIIGFGGTLVGRLLIVDLLNYRFEIIPLRQ